MLTFSVVLPVTLRRMEILERCLEALANQKIPSSRYEILLCGQFYSREARNLVQRIRQERIVQIRYIPVPRLVSASAIRNAGAEASNGAILAFTNEDCVPWPTWLLEAEKAFAPDLDAAWGRVIIPSSCSNERGANLDRKRALSSNRATYVSELSLSTSNCFCRSTVFHSLGGFHDALLAMPLNRSGRDNDFQLRLLHAGRAVKFIPEAAVTQCGRRLPALTRHHSRGAVTYKEAIADKDVPLLKRPEFYRRFIRRYPLWRYF